MKKILLAMFFIAHSYASSDTHFFLQLAFKSNIKEYYKAWTIGYCMGHFEIEENVKIPLTFDADNFKISNMVYLLGVEPLKELKNYIGKNYDKSKNDLDKDRANRCLSLLLSHTRLIMKSNA